MNPFEIIPSYVIAGVDDPTPFDLFTQMMQKIVDAVIPPALKEEAAHALMRPSGVSATSTAV